MLNGSRETTPTKDKIDDVIPKEDPYGEIVKKIAKDKSRSSSPEVMTSRKQEVKFTKASGQINKADKCANGPSLRTRQVTMMLFIITVVFLLSFLPHLILMIYNSMKPDFMDDPSAVGVVFYNLCLRSFVINNMANPIIYGFCDKKFRSEIVEFAMTVISCGKR